MSDKPDLIEREAALKAVEDNIANWDDDFYGDNSGKPTSTGTVVSLSDVKSVLRSLPSVAEPSIEDVYAADYANHLEVGRAAVAEPSERPECPTCGFDHHDHEVSDGR